MKDICPICQLPTSSKVPEGQAYCVISGGDRCYRLGFERLNTAGATGQASVSTIDSDQLDSIRSAIVDGFEMLTAEKPELRDLFAMAAQIGLLVGEGSGDLSSLECSEAAYDLADAMLKVRRR